MSRKMQGQVAQHQLFVYRCLKFLGNLILKSMESTTVMVDKCHQRIYDSRCRSYVDKKSRIKIVSTIVHQINMICASNPHSNSDRSSSQKNHILPLTKLLSIPWVISNSFVNACLPLQAKKYGIHQYVIYHYCYPSVTMFVHKCIMIGFC